MSHHEHQRLEYSADAAFKKAAPRYVNPYDDFDYPNEVAEWEHDHLVNPSSDRPMSLCLWGPSRTGKTALARSFDHHNYWNGYFNLDTFDESAKYAIFDDVDLSQLCKWMKGWFGAQKEFTATDKYRAKRTIKWGKPSILLANDDPRLALARTGGDVDWWDKNVITVHVVNNLF